MIVDAVVERCVAQSPVTVMARLALQRALEPAWIDELFERAGGTQYTRELLFSTTVELMSVVAVGLRPSVHAAAKACKNLPVSVQALYDKIRLDSGLGAALFRSGRCGGCRIELYGADLARVKAAAADDVVRCEECRRIMVRTAESGL